MSMRGSNQCCVKDCVNDSKYGDRVTFHNIPADGLQRANWLLFAGRDPRISTKSLKICEEHFTQDDYRSGFKRAILKPGAVPTVKSNFMDKIFSASPPGLVKNAVPTISPRVKLDTDTAAGSGSAAQQRTNTADVQSKRVFVSLVNVEGERRPQTTVLDDSVDATSLRSTSVMEESIDSPLSTVQTHLVANQNVKSLAPSTVKTGAVLHAKQGLVSISPSTAKSVVDDKGNDTLPLPVEIHSMAAQRVESLSSTVISMVDKRGSSLPVAVDPYVVPTEQRNGSVGVSTAATSLLSHATPTRTCAPPTRTYAPSTFETMDTPPLPTPPSVWSEHVRYYVIKTKLPANQIRGPKDWNVVGQMDPSKLSDKDLFIKTDVTDDKGPCINTPESVAKKNKWKATDNRFVDEMLEGIEAGLVIPVEMAEDGEADVFSPLMLHCEEEPDEEDIEDIYVSEKNVDTDMEIDNPSSENPSDGTSSSADQSKKLIETDAEKRICEISGTYSVKNLVSGNDTSSEVLTATTKTDVSTHATVGAKTDAYRNSDKGSDCDVEAMETACSLREHGSGVLHHSDDHNYSENASDFLRHDHSYLASAEDEKNAVTSMFAPFKMYQCSSCRFCFKSKTSLRKHLAVFSGCLECVVCFEKFGCISVLNRHLLEQHPGPHLCSTCNQTFHTAQALGNHRPKLESRRRCVVCDTAFTCRGLLDRHYLTDHITESEKKIMKPLKHSCEICGKAFETARKYKLHRKVHWTYQCVDCGLTFETSLGLSNHAPTDESNRSCEICKRVFPCVRVLDKHNLQVHKKDKLNTMCRVCGISFESPREFSKHKRSHLEKTCPFCGLTILIAEFGKHVPSDGSQHGCLMCDEKFGCSELLENHECEIHGKEPSKKEPSTEEPKMSKKVGARSTPEESIPFKCATCEKVFKSKSRLIQHEKLEKHRSPQSRSHQCKVCGKAFYTSATLHSHEICVHGQKKTKLCDVCGRGFALQGQLTVHKRIHTGERPHSCEQCHARFRTKTGLESHVLIHTGERPFTCETCGMTFRQRAHLGRHRLLHTGLRPHKCKICSATFAAKSEFTWHMKQGKHRSDERRAQELKCGICHQEFDRKGALSKHLAETHPGDNPFICSTCGKRFKCNNLLRNHNRIHTGEKPFSCKICGKAFTKDSTLHAHKRVHSGQRPYACQICDKTFKQGGNLSTHMNTIHKNEKDFICDVCGAAFKLANTLRQHALTHSSEKPHVCETCGAKFVSARYLVRHQKTHDHVADDDHVETDHVVDDHVAASQNSDSDPDYAPGDDVWTDLAAVC